MIKNWHNENKVSQNPIWETTKFTKTGEGIHHAMDGGKMAAYFLDEALNHGNYDKETMAIYHQRWMDRFGYDFKWSMIFCQLVYRFPILLDAATAAVQRKGDKFLLQWAEIMTGEIAYRVKNVDNDVNLFQVTDGNYYLKAVTSENQDDMTDCRMFKSKTKAKTLMQSAEAFTQVIGQDKIDQMLSKCGDVRNAKLAKTRRNEDFVDPTSDTFNYNLVKGKPFKGDFKTGAPSGAGSHFAIYPGTKWCGYENVAENMQDLGVHNLTDSCCRTHDHCPYYIDRFETKFHYYNYHPWTVSHCDCDQHLYQCLQLAACTDFRERRNIREALRDLKGLKLANDQVLAYSFDPESAKRLSSLRRNLRNSARNSKSEKSSLIPGDKVNTSTNKVLISADKVNRREINNNVKVDSVKNGFVTSPVQERVDNSNAVHAGNTNTQENDIDIDLSEKVLRNGNTHCVSCEENFHVPKRGLRKYTDIKDGTGNVQEVSDKTNTHPASLNLNGTADASTVVRFGSTSQPRHVKRTYSSPFSPTYLHSSLSPVSKTVSRLKQEHESKSGVSKEQVNGKDVLEPNGEKIENTKKIESSKIMKTPDSRRNFSESSVPVTRNELSWADDSKKERSKSCNNEIDYDIDGVKIRKKSALSRKNRVETDWNMSPRLGTKFRKKLGSSDSVSSTTVLGSSTDSIVNAVNTSDKNSVVRADHAVKVEDTKIPESRTASEVARTTSDKADLAVKVKDTKMPEPKTESKVARAASDKRPPIRRKLPDIPIHVSKGEDDSDENIHEKTLRLLQERRQKRRDKLKKETESDANAENSPRSKGSGDEKPRSKKKEIRLRRELQLLNRASENIISKTESQLRKSEQSDSDDDEKPNKPDISKSKPKSSQPLRRSKSDMVRSKPPITPESAARKEEENKTEGVEVKVDLESFDAMPTENKIDLIGNLMQEEAKLQETLRRTTSFSERRKIRSEVRQLREKRTALEGNSEAQPITILQRSVSLSTGELTPSVGSKGSSGLSPRGGKKPSIEELRKQLSETSDYDEKRKIRLALRQLRQQSRESEALKRGTGVQRSQSCLEIKLQTNGNNTDKIEPVRNGIVITDSSSETSGYDKLNEKINDSRTVVRSQSTIELKTVAGKDTAEGLKTGIGKDTGKELANSITSSFKEPIVNETKLETCKHSGKSLENGEPHSVKKQESIQLNRVSEKERNTSQSDINKNEIKTVVTSRRSHSEDGRVLNRIQSGISSRNKVVNDQDSKLKNRNNITGDRNQKHLANNEIAVDEQFNIVQSSVLKKEVDNLSDKGHSRKIHSQTKHFHSQHSVDHSKYHTLSKSSSEGKAKTNTTQNNSRTKPVNTEIEKPVLEKKRTETSDPKTNIAEKPYVKQRKSSLETLADSYRLRDQEDKSNRQFNSSLLKDVIGKLENKISKSIEDKIAKPTTSKALEDRPPIKPTSRILISRANSESSLQRKLKDTDNKSKDKSVKQLKDTKNLSKLQNKDTKSKEIYENEIEKTVLKSVENQNNVKDNKLDATSKQKSTERLSPSIPWLEEKKKSSPTPNELDKLMSTMDIENAFSQILDAVEQCPEGPSISEHPTPDIPIVEEEQISESGASDLQSANEVVTKNKNVKDKSEEVPVHFENDNVDNMTVNQNEMLVQDKMETVTEVSGNTETVDKNRNMSNNNAETNSAIKSNSGITKKSEAKIQLKTSLSLDLSPVPKEPSAISVLHGDDGTVTVQEVNKVQEGDTTVTEWKKVRRTKSKTEERETDTIKERMITSPGGSTSVYEKDVSKTKRKITSRGSDYFTRNNYNLKRSKDLEGIETVHHELSSVSENMSVSKNESWGSKSEAKLTLSKDSANELNLKAITPDGVKETGKDGKVMTLTAEDGSMVEKIETRPTGCPVITESMKEVTVSEGSVAVLECSITASPLPTVSWYKGDKPVQESETVTQHFDSESGKAALKFVQVTPDDVGNYTCVFTNTLGTAETKAVLHVNKIGLGPPSFITKLADVNVTEGCSIVLECEVSQVTSVSWYKDGCIQRDSVDFRQTFDGSKAKLEIGEVFLDDEGTYACAIKNSSGENRCSCRLTVTESTSDHLVPPAFLKKLESQIVDEQDMVIMECDVIGSPQPIIMWYCDRKALPEGDKYSTSYDGRVARLILKNAAKGDNGRYECAAESSAGRITCDCLLVVKEVRTPPSVTKPLSDITVHDGKSAVLECSILGNPPPQIVWRKNGLIIGQMFDFKQSYVNDVARLEIGKVCVQDSGSYECVGTNDLGEISTSCTLIVEEKPATPKTSSNTQNGEVLPAQDNTSASKTKAIKVVKDFPSGFTTISDSNQVKAAKSQASKVMLVRQSSLKSLDRDRRISGEAVKRSESFQTVRQSKVDIINKEEKNLDVPVTKSEMKVDQELKLDCEVKGGMKSETEIIASTDVTLKDGQTTDETVQPELEIDIDSNKQVDEISKSAKALTVPEETSSSMPNVETKTSVSSLELRNIYKKTESVSVDSDKENEGKHSFEVEKDQSVKGGSMLDRMNKSLELDHNENIKVSEKTLNLPQIQVENVSNELELDSNKTDNISSDIKVSPSLVVSMSAKETEMSNVSTLKTAKDKALSKFEKLCSETEEIQAKPKFKVGSDIRRSQSVRTAGSEKPEWLQMKLKKVGEPKSPAVERKIISPLEIDTTPKADTEVEKPISCVPRDIKLTRSHSARIVDRKAIPPLNDSTNTHIPDRNNDKLKITSVSERAKMFQMNQDSSPVTSPILERKKTPSAIIAKAINLSRAESMRAPVGHRNINVHNVQRSHSFKSTDTTAVEKGVTLDLTPPKNEGKESSGESGVAKKPIKYWDPTAAPTTTMDYNSITDEEELNKLLANSDNFEERKKIRARIKEVRDLGNKKWEEERKAREAGQQDLLKQRQKEADLEKQRKLEAYKQQAAQPHESKALDMQERRLKEKHQQADLLKQKELERYDRMARHEDLSQKTTVTQETTRDGKTVTTRKVETVSKSAGVGGTSYGKPAEIKIIPSKQQGGGDNEKRDDAEALVSKLINASSPAVSGTLNVKTESWSSKDGITHKSEKTESWGAKKPAGAMNAFKQMDAKNNPQTNLGPPKGLARSPSAIKTMLLEWTKAMTREYADKIVIENFSTSWNDGIAFCALIHHFYPEAFDFNSLDPKNRRSNFELAFDTAEKYADIAPLLDVEDMVRMKKPDWKCVFCYVQSFYRKLKDHDNNRAK